MPHMRFEYAPGLEEIADLDGFAEAMRIAMAGSGLFQTGGIRVRGFRADHAAIADGAPGHGFMDIVVRMGAGRDDAARAALADALYDAARKVLEPQIGARPFALSLEVVVIDAGTGRKSWNTLHAAVASTRSET